MLAILRPTRFLLRLLKLEHENSIARNIARKHPQKAKIENISFIEADSAEPLTQINYECDAIMLDAPCSGSGTIRRNPDIRIVFDPLELELKSKLQIQFLQNLWQSLRRGGNLLYVTCSIFD